MLNRVLALLVLCLAAPLAGAQERPDHWPVARPAAERAGPADGETLTLPQSADGEQVTRMLAGTKRWHEPVEILFSVVVLAFGVGLILLFTNKLLAQGAAWRGMYLRLVVLTIVVTAGLFVITAGYSEQQIAPMMGLLGTLVGYLLGRESPPAPGAGGGSS
jgi:hypothetical protein